MSEIEAMRIRRIYTKYEQCGYYIKVRDHVGRRYNVFYHPEYSTALYERTFHRYNPIDDVLLNKTIQSFWRNDTRQDNLLGSIIITTLSGCSCKSFKDFRMCNHLSDLINDEMNSKIMSRYIIGNDDIYMNILKFL